MSVFNKLKSNLCLVCKQKNCYVKKVLSCDHKLCLDCYKQTVFKGISKFTNLQSQKFKCPICNLQQPIQDLEICQHLNIKQEKGISSQTQKQVENKQETFNETDYYTKPYCSGCEQSKISIQGLQKKIETLQQNYKQLQDDLREQQILDQQIQEENKKAKEVNALKEDQIQNQQSEIDKLQINLFDIHASKQQLEQYNEEYQNQIQNLQKQLEEEKQKQNKLNEKNKTNTQQYDELNETIKQLNRNNKELERQLKEKRENEQKTKETAQKNQKGAISQNQTNQQSDMHLQRQNEEFQNEIDQLNKKLNKLQEEYNSLDYQLQDIEKICQKSEDEKEKLNNSNEEYKNQISQYEEFKQQFAKEKKIQSEITQSYQQQLQEAQNKLFSLQTQIQKFEEENKEKQQKLDAANDKINEFQQQINQHKQLEQTITQLNSNLEKQANTLSEIENENYNLKQKLESEQENLNKLEELKEKLENENQLLKDQVDQNKRQQKIQSQTEKASEESKILLAKISQLEEEKNKIQQQFKQTQQSHQNSLKEIQILNESISSLNNYIQNNINDMEGLKLKNEKLTKENKEQESKYEALKEEFLVQQKLMLDYENKIRQKQAKELNYEQQIKNLQNQLQNISQSNPTVQNQTSQFQGQQFNLDSQQQNMQLSQAQMLQSQDISSMPQLKQVYPRCKLVKLMDEYKHSQNIKGAIQSIQQKYNSYRSVRGDGNCYYRAVGFSFLEHLIRPTTPIQHLRELIQKIQGNNGYYQMRPNPQNSSHQLLRDTFLQLLRKLEEQKLQNNKFINDYLTDEIQTNREYQDEALVWQMRSISANYLEAHREYFESFCQITYEQLIKDVLTMGKEADGLGIGPLQVVFKVKIEIVTIDRNYAEALSFEQMKIAGMCPLIYILYKPGHYDIIYTREQSSADGFDEYNEIFTGRFTIPPNYNIQNPGLPFFTFVQQNGQECPVDENKQFQIKYHIQYKSTLETKQQVVQAQSQAAQLVKCQACSQEIEQISIVQLQCNHQICKFCLEDKIEQDTNGKIIRKQNDPGKKATCYKCIHILTNNEIEQVVGREKLQKALQSAR